MILILFPSLLKKKETLQVSDFIIILWIIEIKKGKNI